MESIAWLAKAPCYGPREMSEKTLFHFCNCRQRKPHGLSIARCRLEGPSSTLKCHNYGPRKGNIALELAVWLVKQLHGSFSSRSGTGGSRKARKQRQTGAGVQAGVLRDTGRVGGGRRDAISFQFLVFPDILVYRHPAETGPRPPPGHGPWKDLLLMTFLVF